MEQDTIRESYKTNVKEAYESNRLYTSDNWKMSVKELIDGGCMLNGD